MLETVTVVAICLIDGSDYNAIHSFIAFVVISHIKYLIFFTQTIADVIIHLQYRIGRYVRISFKFRSKWLHISEITFDAQSLVNSSANLTQLYELEEALSDSDINNNNSLMATNKDSDQFSMKYSLVIITLVTLGVVIFMVISSFGMRAYNRAHKGNVFREISNTDIESEAQNVNLKDIPKITSPQTLLYCEPKDIAANEEEAEYAVPDVICANGRTKSLQLSSKGIKTNPRYYASSEIIKSKHSLSDNSIKYGKQVLNHYESANYSSQQTPLLTTFMASQATQQPHTDQRNESIDSPQIKRLKENELTVIEWVGSSKFGDVWLAKLADKQQPLPPKDNVLFKTLINVQLKQEFLDEAKFLCQLSKNCDKFAKLFGVLDTSDYFGLIVEYGDCDLNQFLRECDPSVIT